MEQSAEGSPRSRCWPVVWWKLKRLPVAPCGGHTQGGEGADGRENVFRSPVILHNAGQIRLELTAEDIQLDCACHSVASIRAPARVFVSCCRERRQRALPFCVISIYVSGFLYSM